MIAMYACSFDPITLGHEWIIQNAPGDRLIVVVADNPLKKHTFTSEQRCQLVELSIAVMAFPPEKNIEVISSGNVYLANYAREQGAQYLIRGVRSASDYEYEWGYADVNRKINSRPIHILMMPPPELLSVSSSIVKSLVGPVGWEEVVGKFVSPHVVEALRAAR